MLDFECAIKYVLENEGGFVDNPKDPGGRTNMGITQKTLDNFLSLHHMPSVDVANLSLATAKSIYLSEYWTPYIDPEIEQQGQATAIFDMIVNCGPHMAISWAQASCIGKRAPIDGVMGPLTVTLLNETEQTYFIDRFEALVENHYKSICEKDLTKIVFLAGWMRRAERLLTLKEVL